MSYVMAQDDQGSPVVIGPASVSEELREEIESWGWTVISGSARKLTLAQARKEARGTLARRD
jgi:hypothetical protein